MEKTLGREIIIPANAKIVDGITGVQFEETHYHLEIGIGNDHTMSLFIPESALEALNEYKNKLIL